MDDNDLKYIQRVLESNAPDEDRERAAQMVRDIRRSRGRTPHWPVEEQPDGTVTPVDPADIGQDAAIEAIQFALEADEGIAWLRCWNEGDFDACRREWPETPEKCFIGADPLHPATRSAPVAAQAPAMPEGWTLVERKTCYALMHDGAVIATLAGPDSEENAAIIATAIHAHVSAASAEPYCYALETRGRGGLLEDVEYNTVDSFSGGRRGGFPLYKHAQAPQDDFSGVRPPMRRIAGVNVGVLERAACAQAPAANGDALDREKLIDAVEEAISVGPMDTIHADDRHAWGNTWHMEPPPEPRADHVHLQGRRSCATRAVDAMLAAMQRTTGSDR